MILRLECDFLFQYYISLNRLNEVITSVVDTADITIDTLLKLVRQLIGGISTHSKVNRSTDFRYRECSKTRGLDFENLIICSFNEGVFPKKHIQQFYSHNPRKPSTCPQPNITTLASAYNFTDLYRVPVG